MPQFTPGSAHQATITFSNPKSAGFDYTASLCMGADWTVMATASFHLNAGESKPIAFSVTMPATSGTYPVYISVSSGGKVVALFKATEDVVIAAALPTDPNIASLSLAWTPGAIASDFLINSGQTALIQVSFVAGTWNINNQYTLVYSFEVDLVLAGVVKVSGSIYPPVCSSFSLPAVMQMPSTPGVYDAIIKAYRNSVLSGTYPRGQLTVYAPAEPSNLSYENLSFVRTSPTTDPYYTGKVLRVDCDIRNIGNTTITRVVSLWLIALGEPDWRGSWHPIQQVSWTLPVPSGNASTVSLTLAPGQVFHYDFCGGEQITYYPYEVQLRDNMGGMSAIVTG